MKTIKLIILIFLIFVSCKKQRQENNIVSKDENRYQKIDENIISFGEHNNILDYKKTRDNNYRLYIRTDIKDSINKSEFYFFKISPKGDSLKSSSISFKHFLGDYIELENCYYVITTDLRTMGGYTKDFLSKYDKDWKLIWSKKIDKPKYPDGSTVLKLTNNQEILLIANEFIPHSSKKGISIRRYNLNGKIITEKFIPTKGSSNPISIIDSSDNNYYLTAQQYDHTSSINSLWLMKLNQIGDIIWTKEYPNFYSKETIRTKKGDLVFYGSNYSSIKERDSYYHYLKIIVLDEDGNLKWKKNIKQNYYESPGNIIETKNSNLLFSSAITPIKDNGAKAYLFELNKEGELIFEKEFDYSIGIGNVPFLIKSDDLITMVDQKWVGKFGEPFYDKIQIINLKK